MLGSVSGRYCLPACWLAIRPRGLTSPVRWGTEQHAEREGLLGVRPARLARLEAILFLAREPLGSRKLAQLAGLADGTKARTLVRALNRRYDAEGSAFRAEEVAGGFQLMTRPKFAAWLRRLHGTPAEVRLSTPAMETLAVVAYRQPVLRAAVEAIRGVECGEILRQLIERDLVRIVGRSEELGRPLLYGTTRRFMQIFGLRHLEDLPRPEFLPMTKRAPEGGGEPIAEPSCATSNQIHHSRDMLEETEMRTTIAKPAVPEVFGALGRASGIAPQESVANRRRALVDQAKDADEDLDDDDLDDDDDDDDEEDDDDLDDEPWEEVEDDDAEEEEDEDEDEDEEWDDEDWDEDEDEDWDDDDDWDDDEDEDEEDDEEQDEK